ncbi:MAG: hydrogenase formation protein HypD [Candidatus Latescibacteria bacterium 4484_107]|nr:MAG: hydrogenase formation protein HypD [Candidatus Latescibacteria bacterium 4484_107]
MKYMDEFRDPRAAQHLAESIRAQANGRTMRLMEVCGTHTMAVARYGLKGLLPPEVRLVSGPGCPVCVTPNGYIDHAVALCRLEGVTVATFGDMMRVPGSRTSLEQERAEGRDVRVVYSPLDGLRLASEHPERKVVFLGIGFETTIPGVAASILEADRSGLPNFFVLSAHKVMPPAMGALAGDPEIEVDGFLCPGHVSVIIGAEAYRFIAEDYGIPCVVAGFEPLDVLRAVELLAAQVAQDRAEVEIQYRRAVRPEGNRKARALVEQVFEPSDANWRGIGIIEGSGLKIRERFRRFDAAVMLDVTVEPAVEPKGCICGAVLKGTRTPGDCGLFGKRCTPEHPIGACMVSSEGTCAAWFRYGADGE